MILDDDTALIEYCAEHCQQPRPLFIGYHVRRMYELAEEAVPEPLFEEKFYQLTFTMQRLVKAARARQRRKKMHVVHIQD